MRMYIEKVLYKLGLIHPSHSGAEKVAGKLIFTGLATATLGIIGYIFSHLLSAIPIILVMKWTIFSGCVITVSGLLLFLLFVRR